MTDQKASTGTFLNVELIGRRAVVLGGRDVEIDGVLIGIEAPG